MASLNTLRTKYGIVLSVVIALVLLAFIFGGDLFTSLFNSAPSEADQVAMKINGKEISNRDFYEAGQNEAGVIYEYFYTPELEKVGLGLGDESAVRSALAVDFMNQGMSEEDVLATLNQTSSALLAQFAAVNSLSAGHFYNDIDVAAFEAAKSKTFSGSYVAYPYTSAEEVVVSDKEVKAYYDSLTLSNIEFGARSYIYVEFPHPAVVAEEAAEEAAEATTTSNLEVEVRVNAFMQRVNNDVESFKKAATDAGLEYFSNTAKIADGMAGVMPLGSQEFGSWVYYYAAEVGDVQKFVVGDRTYVVMVESVNEEEKLPYEVCESALRTKLYNQKFADSVIANMPATIEEGAEVVEFNGIKLTDSFEDLHLLGAICSANAGDVIKVKGDKAAYLVVVNSVEEDANAVKVEANTYMDLNKNQHMQRIASAFDSNIDIEYVSIEAPVR